VQHPTLRNYARYAGNRQIYHVLAMDTMIIQVSLVIVKWDRFPSSSLRMLLSTSIPAGMLALKPASPAANVMPSGEDGCL
jgi:hypothetical protein